MRILHVTLGNPYTHQGGLNRYCTEVMDEQSVMGHEVFVLYPGRISSSKIAKIRKVNDNSFVMENSLPVAITYGIDNPSRYYRRMDKTIFVEWLNFISPDVIHVHSIQGIYCEFFQAAKELNIRLIYTTHDYYFLCFKAVLFLNSQGVCSGYDKKKCCECNFGCGLNERKQQLIQSSLYQTIKKHKCVLMLKKKLSYTKARNNAIEVDYSKIEEFDHLHEYYLNMLNLFDVVHCNSENTYEMYSKYCKEKCIILPITHKGLIRKRHMRRSDFYNITYMGGESEHKGYLFFEKVIKRLENDSTNKFLAHFYGGEFSSSDTQFKIYHGYFGNSNVEEVWDNTDILVAPSLCKETFGFVILEALSRGIPVVASNMYGSAFLLNSLKKSLVYDYSSVEQCEVLLKNLMETRNYEQICKSIEALELPLNMKTHVEQLYRLYEG